MLTSIKYSPFSLVSDLKSSRFCNLFVSISIKTRNSNRTCVRNRSYRNPERKVDSFRFCELRRGGEGRNCCCRVVRRCKGEDREGDWILEEEILEFMRNSDKPERFPSKKDFVDAGRMDLVEAISKQGGWLSLGWNLDEDNLDDEVDEVFDNGRFVRPMVDIGQEWSNLGVDSSQSASSSGRSLDLEGGDDAGIEGILSRLEKQRNRTFGIELRAKGISPRNLTGDGEKDWQHEVDATLAGNCRSRRHASLSLAEGVLNNTGINPDPNNVFSDFNGPEDSHKHEMWQTWINHRAGFPDAEFEAAEISFSESREVGDPNHESIDTRDSTDESLDRQGELSSIHKETNSTHIRVRLQHLEMELASALRVLRSSSHEVVNQKAPERSPEDLQNLSDVWEFQENEVMHAKDRLRSTRAKLAVLEGKMALALNEAQKIMDEKQKKIDNASRALRFLRTACIVWPNSASEVLLSGSFDGWSTQRKMERSSTGIFSLCLKLYPGTYEIKFIVDGAWRIDPLRPITRNTGYENNLLIIT